jgi:hypothetical protein
MLLAAVGFSNTAIVAALWPVTALSEVICRRVRGSRVALQIPVATLLLFLEVTSVGLLIALLKEQPIMSGITTGAIVGVVLLIPLGIYWWSLQVTDWLINVGESLYQRLVRQIILHR